MTPTQKKTMNNNRKWQFLCKNPKCAHHFFLFEELHNSHIPQNRAILSSLQVPTIFFLWTAGPVVIVASRAMRGRSFHHHRST
jgi:hypothetical protein